MPQTRLSLLIVVFALAAGGCRRQPARPPPPPPPRAPAPAPAPKPSPPPSCKSLDQKCTARAATALQIGDGAATFQPPPGWTYARESEASVAIAPGSVGVMAFSTAATPWSRDTARTIDRLFNRLQITKVVHRSLRERLRRPQTKVASDSGLKVELWEVNRHRQFGRAPELGGKPSSVLVIVSRLPGGHAVVGAAAVLKPGGDDKVPAIMQAVKSLRSGK